MTIHPQLVNIPPKPILAMPGFWQVFVQTPLPYSETLTSTMISSGTTTECNGTTCPVSFGRRLSARTRRNRWSGSWGREGSMCGHQSMTRVCEIVHEFLDILFNREIEEPENWKIFTFVGCWMSSKLTSGFCMRQAGNSCQLFSPSLLLQTKLNMSYNDFCSFCVQNTK